MENFEVKVDMSKDDLKRIESALLSHIKVLYVEQIKYMLDGLYETARDVKKELAELRKLYNRIHDI